MAYHQGLLRALKDTYLEIKILNLEARTVQMRRENVQVMVS